MKDFLKNKPLKRQAYSSPGMSYPAFKKKPFDLTDAGQSVREAYVKNGFKGAYKKRMSLMDAIKGCSFNDDNYDYYDSPAHIYPLMTLKDYTKKLGALCSVDHAFNQVADHEEKRVFGHVDFAKRKVRASLLPDHEELAAKKLADLIFE